MLSRAPSRGFTLVEITVAIAILALLAMVLVPQLLSRLTGGQATALASSLSAVSTGVESFRGDIGRYPSTLVHLSDEPSSADDLCDRSIPANLLSNWSGPYLNRRITTSGIVSGNSTIQATLRREPETYSGFGDLLIDAAGVDLDVAQELEEAFDGNGNLSSGTIRWAADEAANRGTLSYAIPVRGC